MISTFQFNFQFNLVFITDVRDDSNQQLADEDVHANVFPCDMDGDAIMCTHGGPARICLICWFAAPHLPPDHSPPRGKKRSRASSPRNTKRARTEASTEEWKMDFSGHLDEYQTSTATFEEAKEAMIKAHTSMMEEYAALENLEAARKAQGENPAFNVDPAKYKMPKKPASLNPAKM